MQITEIGQQLRAYRLESGLRVEEIASRLGVSRAALYRYEKGDVIKLDTVTRLAELLQISPLTLLGIGVEYYHRPVGYFERVRQLEETADQILQVNAPINYLNSTSDYNLGLTETFAAANAAVPAGEERDALTLLNEQVLAILAERKRMYSIRRPTIISIISPKALCDFLRVGIGGGTPMSAELQQRQRMRAVNEIRSLIAKMETEPMGVQIGMLAGAEPTGAFSVFRTQDRAWLAMNPFRPDATPATANGVAMVTAAKEAIAAHQRVAQGLWAESLKGAVAANRARALLAEFSV